VPFRIIRRNGDPVEVTSAELVFISAQGSWVMLELPNDASTRISASDIIRMEVIGFPTPEDLEFL